MSDQFREVTKMVPVRCGCGGEALPCYCDIFGTKYWSVTCQECLTHTDRFDTEAEAVKAWNRAMGGNVQECAENARYSERTAKVYWNGLHNCCSICSRPIETTAITRCAYCGAKLERE